MTKSTAHFDRQLYIPGQEVFAESAEGGRRRRSRFDSTTLLRLPAFTQQDTRGFGQPSSQGSIHLQQLLAGRKVDVKG